MAAVRYTAIRWAREVPTLLHRGRVDRLAHHLLLLLATYAKNDGSDMYASVSTLAKDARSSTRDVVAALGRLETAGLIAQAHASNGVEGWSLNLSERSDEDAVVEAREARRKAAARARTRAWRKRKQAVGDGEVVRHVTPNCGVTGSFVTPQLGVTSEDVTQEFGVRDAEEARHVGDVTHQCDAGDAQVAVTNGHLPAKTGPNSLELPKDRTPKDELPADADASGASELALDGVKRTTKRGKQKAADPRDAPARDLAQRYYDAMNGMVQFIAVQQIVKQALGRFSYDEVRDGLKHMATKDRSRTLTRQSLLAAIENPGGRRNGHKPYQNSQDPDAYHGELIS